MRLTLHRSEHSYDIQVGAGLLSQIPDQIESFDASSVAIVTDSHVAPLYLDSIQNSLGDSLLTSIVLPPGEGSKSWEGLQQILDQLLRSGMDRKGLLLALGGGVIGDLAGLAASLYLRGIRVVQIPTTLLAQVDSAVGGKTAINHPMGKNLIGTFHQPSLVIADTDTLHTLPKREWVAGMAELIKTALISDPKLTEILEHSIHDLLHRVGDISSLIARACELKANIVREDETETNRRRILNFGHTVAHALEASTPPDYLRHGEAVIHGMRSATQISVQAGFLNHQTYERISRLLDPLPVPSVHEVTCESSFWKALQADKKTVHDRLHLVLLRDIGDPFLWCVPCPEEWISIPE